MLLVSHTVVNLGALNCPSRKVYEVIKRSILEFTIVYWDILSMTRNMYLWLQKQKVHIPGIDPSLAFYEQWLLICTVDPSFIVDPCHDIQVAFILHWYLVPSFKPLLDHVAPADICPQYSPEQIVCISHRDDADIKVHRHGQSFLGLPSSYLLNLLGRWEPISFPFKLLELLYSTRRLTSAVLLSRLTKLFLHHQ